MKDDKKNLFISLAVFAAVAIMGYAVIRTTLFFFSRYTGAEKFFAVLLISGEIFVIVHGFGYVLNMVQAFIRPAPDRNARATSP